LTLLINSADAHEVHTIICWDMCVPLVMSTGSTWLVLACKMYPLDTIELSNDAQAICDQTNA
jgi:hypothetical protein